MSPAPVRPAVRAFVAVLALSLVILPAVMPARADVTQNFDHLWQDHILPKIQPAGTINQNANPVHWTKLKGVPGGFADSFDYPVTLGMGLEKSGFGQGLKLDFEEISQNTGPAVYAGFKDDTGPLCAEFCTEGFMNVPAGMYAIFAKITFHGSIFEDHDEMTCELDVGSRVIIDTTTEFGDEIAGSLSLMGVRTFPSQGYIGVNCEGHGRGEDLKITAIKLGDLTNAELQNFDS